MFRDYRDPRLIASASCARREGESDYAAVSRLAGLCRQLAEALAGRGDARLRQALGARRGS